MEPMFRFAKLESIRRSRCVCTQYSYLAQSVEQLHSEGILPSEEQKTSGSAQHNGYIVFFPERQTVNELACG